MPNSIDYQLDNPIRNRWKFVPFTCFLKIDPRGIRRFEVVRQGERLARMVQDALEGFCAGATEDGSFDFTRPVAYTPQFGQKTTRLSFSGHFCRRETFTKTPIGQRWVDTDSGLVYGPGAANTVNSIPDPELDELVKVFKFQVESLTGLTVIRIMAAGFIYGEGGVHFPI